MIKLRDKKVQSISVVTVCLNTYGTIRLTMESVARQNFPDVRHVIIDGNSTDGTLNIVQEYDPQYVVSEKDDGIYAAMDKGALAADGDLIIFLNAGDTFFDDSVCSRIAAFAEKSKADIIFGDLLPVRIYRSDTSDHQAFQEGETLKLGYMRNRKFLYNESIHHQATFYRRSVFEKSQYLNDERHASGEYNLLLDAVFNHGAVVKYTPSVVSRFALGGTSTADFETEWKKYTAARETLRQRYMPSFDAIKTKSENEFLYASTLSPITRAKQMIKSFARKSPFYKLYARMANGIAGRAALQVKPDLQHIAASQDRAHASLSELIEELKKTSNNQLKDLKRSVSDLTVEVRAPERIRHEMLTLHGLNKLESDLQRSTLNAARVAEATGLFDRDFGSGYSAYSQWDEDGILQYLTRKLNIKNKTFVEFGVSDYTEANTRLLLIKDGWSGLVMDNDTDRVTLLRNSDIAWRYPLTILEESIEPDNINEILMRANFVGDIGILSIDIDGMDYWVWDAIDVVSPAIVVCEYNSLWGPDRAVTVPYERGFDRTAKHYSWAYAGTSLEALRQLGEQKGYQLVCGNNAGNNAFFVKADLLKNSEISIAQHIYRLASFREARNQDGTLSFAPPEQVLEILEDLELFDIEQGKTIKIKGL